MASLRSESNALSGIWRAVRWPTSIVLLVASLVAVGFAFKILSVITTEGSDTSSGIGGLLIFFSAFACFFAVVCIIFALIDDVSDNGRLLWQFPFAVAIGQYSFIALFYLIAGGTYPLPTSMAPLITQSGDVYLAGEEVPRRYIESAGAPLSTTHEYEHTVTWSDPAYPQLEFTTSVTIVASLTDNRDILNRLVAELFDREVTMSVVNNEMWDLFDPEVERLKTTLNQLAREGRLSERTVLTSDYLWIETVRVKSTQTTVAFVNN